MKKQLLPNVERQLHCDKFSRDALTSVVCRSDRHVVAQVKPDRDEVTRQMRRRRDARHLATLRLRRDTLQEMDSENKENVCYSKHLFQCDGAKRRKRRHHALPSSVEFRTATCSCDSKELSLSGLSPQLDRFFVDVPLTGRPSRCRASHDDDTTVTHLADSRKVPDVVREELAATTAAADNDTSVWSAVSFNDIRRPPSAASKATVCVSPILEPELSQIRSSSPAEQRELREQTSSGDLTGAFHSTFSYPLHSTLLSAAVSNVNVSSVLETDAAGHHLEQIASDDEPLINSKSSFIANDVDDVGRKDCSTNNRHSDLLFDHVATSEHDHIKAKNSGQYMNPTVSRFSCCTETGKHGDLNGRTSGRVMSYFPPLSTMLDTSTSSAAAATTASDINTPRPLRQQVSDDGDVADSRTVRDNKDTQTNDVDTSVEAVRGSSCDGSHDPSVTLMSSQGLDVDSRLTPSCGRCRLDTSASSRPSHRPSHGREGRCVSGNSTSKSGGREMNRMARVTGRCDLRDIFDGSHLVQGVRYECRDLFYRPLQGQIVDSWPCRSTRVYQRQRHCRRRPRHSCCRCGVESVNFVDLRTGRSSHDRRRSVLPSGESENKPRVKRSERYLDPVRKRTLVNRLKQFSGCFSDTGCGRRMRTLANV